MTIHGAWSNEVFSNRSSAASVVLVPMVSVAPVFVADLPVLIGIGLAALESIELLVLCDVKIEFNDNRPVVGELALEFVDLAIGALPFCFRAKFFNALDQHAPVPRAVEDGDLTVGRQLVPKAPHVVMLDTPPVSA